MGVIYESESRTGEARISANRDGTATGHVELSGSGRHRKTNVPYDKAYPLSTHMCVIGVTPQSKFGGIQLMTKLTEVDHAKALMTEAIDWSVVKWLAEKKRVRRTADKANEILNAVEQEIHGRWSPKFKGIFDKSGTATPDLKHLATKIREEHDAANRLRLQAEDTFDVAEKRLSTAMARDGCRQAIEGWNHHVEAIRLAESALEIK